MSLTIDAAADLHTLINTFTVQSGKQGEAVACLRAFTEAHAHKSHGFVGAAVHVSLDGTRVINYVQWESEADLAAMLATPAAQAHMAVMAALVHSVTPVFCGVAYVGSRALDRA